MSRPKKTALPARKRAAYQSTAQSRCSIFVSGVNLKCPLCDVLVCDGEMHTCKRPKLVIAA